jgi:DNA-binding Lrp family transcriptional regulator
LDLANVSLKRGYTDKGRAFVLRTHESIAEELNCGRAKAARILKELESVNLIQRKKMGYNRADRIFLNNLSMDLAADGKMNNSNQLDEIDSNFDFFESDISSKSNTIKNKNKTEFIKTYSSTQSINMYSGEEFKDFIENYKYQIDFEHLSSIYTDGIIQSIYHTIIGVFQNPRKTYRIKGVEWSSKQVIDKLKRLEGKHLEFVRHVIKANEKVIKNIEMYVIVSLVTADKTMDIRYENDFKSSYFSTDENE